MGAGSPYCCWSTLPTWLTDTGSSARAPSPRRAQEVDLLRADVDLNHHASLPALAEKALSFCCGCHETRYLKTVTL
jgi:hypothetical protein